MVVPHEMGFDREVEARVFFMDDGEIIETGTSDQVFDSHRKQRSGECFLFLVHSLRFS